MAMRGAAPSTVCPRCGTVAPPTGQRLLSCATCKLTFDATREPTQAPRRERAELAAPAGLERVELDGGVELRIPSSRLHGVTLVVVAIFFGVILLRALIIDPYYRDILFIVPLVAAPVVLYAGLAIAMGTRVIRLDRGVLTSRLVPLSLPPRVKMARSEVGGFDLFRQPRGPAIVVMDRGGEPTTLVLLSSLGTDAREIGDYVVGELTDAFDRSSRTS